MRESKARFSSPLLGTQSFHFMYLPTEHFFPFAQSSSSAFNKSSATTSQIFTPVGTGTDELSTGMMLPASTACKFSKKVVVPFQNLNVCNAN